MLVQQESYMNGVAMKSPPHWQDHLGYSKEATIWYGSSPGPFRMIGPRLFLGSYSQMETRYGNIRGSDVEVLVMSFPRRQCIGTSAMGCPSLDQTVFRTRMAKSLYALCVHVEMFVVNMRLTPSKRLQMCKSLAFKR